MALLFDTNVLIYAYDPGSPYHAWAEATLFQALSGKGAAINPVILAELCVGEMDPETVPERLVHLGMLFLDLPCSAARRAAESFAMHLDKRKAAGVEPSSKVPLPDFFIGAHAELIGLPLATVDVSRYQTYFPKVDLVTPFP